MNEANKQISHITILNNVPIIVMWDEEKNDYNVYKEEDETNAKDFYNNSNNE